MGLTSGIQYEDVNCANPDPASNPNPDPHPNRNPASRQAAHMDYIGETGDVNYADMVEALCKDYLDWYILTQVRVICHWVDQGLARFPQSTI